MQVFLLKTVTIVIMKLMNTKPMMGTLFLASMNIKLEIWTVKIILRLKMMK